MTLPKDMLVNGVQQVVLNRLQRLPASARPLLNLPASIGRQVDLKLIRILDHTTNFEEWLTICSNAAVLDVQDQIWRFAHDRIRDSILSTLTNGQSLSLHLQVAMGLETAYAESVEEYAARIADHYEAANLPASALPWCIRAARHAEDTYAPTIAIIYYRKALALWKYSDNPPSIEMQVGKIYEQLGELLNGTSQYADALELFREMSHIAEQVADKRMQAQAWRGIARAQTYQGDMLQALNSAALAKEFAHLADSPSLVAHASWMQSWIHSRIGNLDTARKLAEKVLQLCQTLGETSLLGNTYNLLGGVQVASGDYRAAAGSLEQALEIFQQQGDGLRAMTIVNNLGWLMELRGDYTLASTFYEEALSLARKYGHRNAEILYLSNLGGTQEMRGEYAFAEATLLQVIEIADDSKPWHLSETYKYLAQAYLGQGKVFEALSAAQRALHLGQMVHSQEYTAAAWRVLGLVAAKDWLGQITVPEKDYLPGKPYDTRACFNESLGICDEGDLNSEKAKTLRIWATYELEQGNIVDADAMWAEARSIFLDMGADKEVGYMDAYPLM